MIPINSKVETIRAAPSTPNKQSQYGGFLALNWSLIKSVHKTVRAIAVVKQDRTITRHTTNPAYGPRIKWPIFPSSWSDGTLDSVAVCIAETYVNPI